MNTATAKLTKFQLAELAAAALNLLNDVDRETFTSKQTDDFHKLVYILLVYMLPDSEQAALHHPDEGCESCKTDGKALVDIL